MSGIRGASQGYEARIRGSTAPALALQVICTIRVMHRTLRVIYIFQFCVHPLALGDPPAGRPGRPEPAPCRIRSHLPTARRAATLPTDRHRVLRLRYAGPWPVPARADPTRTDSLGFRARVAAYVAPAMSQWQARPS